MYDEATAAAAPEYPLRYDVEYPEELSRWLIFVKWLLDFPHFIILYLLGIASSVVGFIAFFAILFTKPYPRRDSQRQNAVVGQPPCRFRCDRVGPASGYTLEYPPFGLR